MGRYEQYKRPKPQPKPMQKKVVLTIRYVLITLILLSGLAVFILQIVMDQKK